MSITGSGLFRVLVFPAGTEVGLEVFAALRGCRNVTLFGTGEDVSNPARFVFPSYYPLPSVHSEGWLSQLVELCSLLKITHIFPAHDDVIVALSANREHIPALLVTSSHNVCATTRSKSATYDRLANSVRVPRMYRSADEVSHFPVLVKPDKGQGSWGVQRVDSVKELIAAIASIPDGIICEYLPGEEYTVDCFSNRHSELAFVGARIRHRMRNGISVNTRTIELPEAHLIAGRIHEELQPRGAWFFQLKRDASGQLALLEVAPRIAGAMAAHRVTGVNFPLLSLMDSDGIDVTISPNDGAIELDRCLQNHYRHNIRFDTVYFDLDDTLLQKGKVNLDVVKLIFKCVNAKWRVVLLTRHAGNLRETLVAHRLAQLFDDIIHITDGSPKANYITEPNAIFVDDSFSERQAVARQCKIPTFDLSMIELLCESAQGAGLASVN